MTSNISFQVEDTNSPHETGEVLKCKGRCLVPYNTNEDVVMVVVVVVVCVFTIMTHAVLQ